MLNEVPEEFMNEEIRAAIGQLQEGRVILYPTDTIWGLGCDPGNQNAVNRIFSIKKRDKNKPLIILVDTIERLRGLVPKIHPHLENILHFNERPLTIVFPGSTVRWADGITGENGSIAIRIVKNDFCREIIEGLDRPIVSTSANVSGTPFPKTFDDIDLQIKEEVDHVVSMNRVEDPDEAMPSLIAKYSSRQKELVFLRQ